MCFQSDVEESTALICTYSDIHIGGITELGSSVESISITFHTTFHLYNSDSYDIIAFFSSWVVINNYPKIYVSPIYDLSNTIQAP